jgi:hypothetical protein
MGGVPASDEEPELDPELAVDGDPELPCEPDVEVGPDGAPELVIEAVCIPPMDEAVDAPLEVEAPADDDGCDAEGRPPAPSGEGEGPWALEQAAMAAAPRGARILQRRERPPRARALALVDRMPRSGSRIS